MLICSRVSHYAFSISCRCAHYIHKAHVPKSPVWLLYRDLILCCPASGSVVHITATQCKACVRYHYSDTSAQGNRESRGLLYEKNRMCVVYLEMSHGCFKTCFPLCAAMSISPLSSFCSSTCFANQSSSFNCGCICFSLTFFPTQKPSY